ncbi:MAG: alanine racemase [Parcubacteria group bacterium GW2011_GWC2_38_7]|nr:MAG: alanine racemase [Parcubacteria group bacterium GW2011_GWC2_38_7]
MNNQKTWVEVDQGKILNNFNQFRKRVGKEVKIASVIKSNAYGHGLENVAQILKNKTDYFAVDSISEALIVRKISKRPIVILGYTPEGEYAKLLNNNIDQTVFDLSNLIKLEATARRLHKVAQVHLEIETGTSRNGILLADLPKYLEIIKKSKSLHLVGLFTHFANIEDTTNHSYAEKQLKTYKEAVKLVTQFGFTDYIKHTACTAASILFDKTYFDMIRLGIGLYGMWPSKETKISAQNNQVKIKLQSALTWKTRIAHLNSLPAKTYVSYGCTERLMRDSLVAVIPVGYYDGFDRGLSNVGEVLVGGLRCPVLGRICMNMTMIDRLMMKLYCWVVKNKKKSQPRPLLVRLILSIMRSLLESIL